MAQTTVILNALKKELKRQGKVYADVANALDVSTASVKRLFSEEGFSLKRLDQVCGFLGIEISDLVLSMRDEEHIQSLSVQQEEELVADLSLLLIANCVLNGWGFEDILTHYSFTEHELTRHLAKLDRLKLIHLLPGNRIKVLVDRHFSWLKNGPINRFFEEKVKQEFFTSRFTAVGEKRLFLVGMLSRGSNAIMQRKLEKLQEEFYSLHYEDEKLPRAEKFGTTIVAGMRLWEPKVFEELRRHEDQRRF